MKWIEFNNYNKLKEMRMKKTGLLIASLKNAKQERGLLGKHIKEIMLRGKKNYKGGNIVRAILKIFVICIFVTGWQAYSKNAEKIASHSVHQEFITIKSNEKFPMDKDICVIKTEKTGENEFRAESYEGAFSQGIESCFQKQVRLFVKAEKRHPGQDEQIEFADICVDNIRCVRQE